jgi:O-acetyl-ADP-ribose deacetylase (regulator of RNase III)
MGRLIEQSGNLFDSSAIAYAHGVNTAGLMGAGIAVEFKRRWPDMYQYYKKLCGGPLIVGDTVVADQLRPGSMMSWETMSNNPRWIFNIASQDRPGPYARLEWFESGLRRVLDFAKEFPTISLIAMPRIGCGIGGLAWDDVKEILDFYVRFYNVDIEVFTPPYRPAYILNTPTKDIDSNTLELEDVAC